MKLSLKIISIFLIFALLTSCVAATENKNLPTKEEITDFISGIPVSDNYITTVFDAVKDEKPSWNCDTWKDKDGNQILSLYYVDPDSEKGYGSIYFNELGKEISVSGVELELVDHYVGKDVSEEGSDQIKNEETSKDHENIASGQGQYEYRQTDTVNNYSENGQTNTGTTTVNNYSENGQTNTGTTTINNYYYNETKETKSEDTPAKEPEASSASVNLYGEKTKVLVGEDILLRLSAVNLITKPTMHVQAIIIPPSGMRVSSTEFVESGAGQYTTTYDLEPGKGKDIEVRIAATDQAGDFNVTGRVVYYFGNNNESVEDKTLDLPIHVEDPKSQPEPKEKYLIIPNIPGFGAASLGMILIMIYLLRRN